MSRRQVRHHLTQIQGYYKWFIRFQNAIYLKTNESFIVTLYLSINIWHNAYVKSTYHYVVQYGHIKRNLYKLARFGIFNNKTLYLFYSLIFLYQVMKFNSPREIFNAVFLFLVFNGVF
jgi:hypothetical protein